jgi:hypothetical protein
LEVRNRSDGHPPFTERERVIHLNGIGGVKFYERLGLIVDPSLFSFRSDISVERWPLSVERWAFLS